MALTKPSMAVNIITSLATTSAERGLTEAAFKAKFDVTPAALKAYLIAMCDELDAVLAEKATLTMTLNEKTANYELAAGDNGEILIFTSATGYTLTIPAGTTLVAGYQVTVLMSGTGAVTIDPAEGVTLNGATDSLSLEDQYKAVTLLKTGVDTWVAVGAI